MPQAFLTIIAKLPLDRVDDAATLIDRMENPACDAVRGLLAALDAAGNGLHFASMHALRSADGRRGYLLLECSSDGTEAQAIARLVTLAAWLRPVLQFASDWQEGVDLAAYLRAHSVTVGGGWRDNPGIVFSGTPGFSVGRILTEARLADAVGGKVAAQDPHLPALARLAELRHAIADEPALAPMLEAGPQDPPFVAPPFASFIASLILPFVTTYLWPFGLLILVWTLGHGVWSATHLAHGHHASGLWYGLWAGLRQSVIASIILTIVSAGAIFLLLRRLEASDVPSEATVDRATNAAMFARENHGAQNHMISITQRKPGFVRAFTSRAVFWAIGQYASKDFPPGFLSDIGTIHFARWVTAPGSPDVFFLSNYGGSWESYLEDFITRAHAGLTGVWSNTIGFPRTENLVSGGATDGERFKRFARHSMVPTRFWFSAYPDLTTADIRTNAAIRHGLAGAMTEDEAIAFLALFGSAARPASRLVENDIQSLILGGLGFLPYGTCLLGTLPQGDVAAARTWLAQALPEIAFADGRRIEREAVVTLGVTAQGLTRLGLPKAGLDSFPFTFLEGVATEARGRILGDLDTNAPAHWRWGRQAPDVVLLVYGRSTEAVAALEARLPAAIAWHRIPLQPVQPTEPFGFADGISQPVIRGTHKGFRGGDPIHLVEAGEFVLGYPDNRGNLPPGPVLTATDDPENMLPLRVPADGFARTVVEAERDLGFNGSYLVIRELEQDVPAFHAYCETEAAALQGQGRFSCPVTPEFVGAKMVGRWQDGSPLVRHPFDPAEQERARYERHGHVSRKMSGIGNSPGHAPETARPKSAPASGGAVARPVGGHSRVENDFLFGTEDPEALRCPFGAHIRRANPRDSFDPGSADQIAISNRHRIMRVGRRLDPVAGGKEGLLFMCFNGDIERQFEFLQQSWIGNTAFQGLADEEDPLLGRALPGTTGFSVPTPQGPTRLKPMRQFVTTKGAGYFFVPGRRLIEFLCRPV